MELSGIDRIVYEALSAEKQTHIDEFREVYDSAKLSFKEHKRYDRQQRREERRKRREMRHTHRQLRNNRRKEMKADHKEMSENKAKALSLIRGDPNAIMDV